ncbi:hypothetical protein SPHINGO8AM_40080 [Sphingomonas sp. 8AM]|nr:hypothetical protein SPHINGO8AM_40080 [Sphingomonas sp. 8AM]
MKSRTRSRKCVSRSLRVKSTALPLHDCRRWGVGHTRCSVKSPIVWTTLYTKKDCIFETDHANATSWGISVPKTPAARGAFARSVRRSSPPPPMRSTSRARRG